MKFGTWPTAECEGGILAHSLSLGGGSLRKGHRLTHVDLEVIAASGRQFLTIARIEPEDIGEDDAAARLAGRLYGRWIRQGPSATGRCNLYAEAAGVLMVSCDSVHAINRVNEAITVACLAPYAAVEAGQMIATVKIIPFAVPASALWAAETCIPGAASPVFTLFPYRPRPVALIQTLLPTLKDSVLDKTSRVMRARLAAMGCHEVSEHRCPHEITAVRQAVELTLHQAGLIVLVGASAMTDRADIIPSALLETGGQIDHLGMPVDPGNLLLLATVSGIPVIGAPGCVRSPALNGFDWVVQRLIAGIPVTGDDIAQMGVGGLLMETSERALPRDRIPNL